MKNELLFTSGASNNSLDFASLALRIIAGGAMFYSHGIGKFQKLFSDQAIQFADPFGLGAAATFNLVVFAEFLCAGLIIIGLFTRFALIPLVINMAYIVFVFHAADDFAAKEIAVLYLVMYAAILLIGPGKYSLDRLIKKRPETIFAKA